MTTPDDQPTREELARWLEREQRVRREAESIAESVTGQLYESGQRLERANRDLHAFMAMTAHDLRGPLTTILGTTELFERFDELDVRTREAVLGSVRRSGRRLQRLVDDLVLMSTIRAGTVEPRPSDVVVADAVAGVVQDVGLDPGEVVVAVAPDAVARVDPHHLERILTNMVENAVKYGEPPVEVAAGQSDDEVTVRVTDHGPGVGVEHVDDLFDAFVRAPEAVADLPGAGLGLAIVRELARANGGDVRHESAQPHGATFVVRLPAATA